MIIVIPHTGKEYETTETEVKEFLRRQVEGKNTRGYYARQDTIEKARAALLSALENDERWKAKLINKQSHHWQDRTDKAAREKEMQRICDDITNQRTEDRQAKLGQWIIAPFVIIPPLALLAYALGVFGVTWEQVAAVTFLLLVFGVVISGVRKFLVIFR